MAANHGASTSRNRRSSRRLPTDRIEEEATVQVMFRLRLSVRSNQVLFIYVRLFPMPLLSIRIRSHRRFPGHLELRFCSLFGSGYLLGAVLIRMGSQLCPHEQDLMCGVSTFLWWKVTSVVGGIVHAHAVCLQAAFGRWINVSKVLLVGMMYVGDLEKLLRKDAESLIIC